MSRISLAEFDDTAILAADELIYRAGVNVLRLVEAGLGDGTDWQLFDAPPSHGDLADELMRRLADSAGDSWRDGEGQDAGRLLLEIFDGAGDEPLCETDPIPLPEPLF